MPFTLPAFEVIKMKVREGHREGTKTDPWLSMNWPDDRCYSQPGDHNYSIILESVSVAIGAVEKEYASTQGPASSR